MAQLVSDSIIHVVVIKEKTVLVGVILPKRGPKMGKFYQCMYLDCPFSKPVYSEREFFVNHLKSKHGLKLGSS